MKEQAIFREPRGEPHVTLAHRGAEHRALSDSIERGALFLTEQRERSGPPGEAPVEQASEEELGEAASRDLACVDEPHRARTRAASDEVLLGGRQAHPAREVLAGHELPR